MSNSWYYELNLDLPPQAGLRHIISALTLAKVHGFDAHNPRSGLIRVMSGTGLDYREFGTAEEASDFLLQDEGSIQLWKDDVDIELYTSRQVEAHGLVKSVAVDMLPAPRALGLSVDNTWFRQRNVSVATTLSLLFQDLCEYLHPLCGYSVDEDFWELRSHSTLLSKDVRNGRQPSILYWLNYYPATYVHHLDLAALEQFGATVNSLPHGVVASLFHYPWEVDAHLLLSINDRWSEWLYSTGIRDAT